MDKHRKQIVKDLNDIIKIQRAEAKAEKKRGDGNYMRGLANGLICAKATILGKEAKYIEA